MADATNKGPGSVKEMLQMLMMVIETKDPGMKDHAERVASTATLFARKLGLEKGVVYQVYVAGMLHDIGMVYIPPEMINHERELTEEEMALIQKHPSII